MSGLEMKYFVLKPNGTSAYSLASREAMSVFADMIEYENPEFAKDIRDWVFAESQADTTKKPRKYV